MRSRKYKSEDEGRFVFEMVCMEKVGDFYGYIGLLYLEQFLCKYDTINEIEDLLNKIYFELEKADEEHLVELLLANLALSKGLKNVVETKEIQYLYSLDIDLSLSRIVNYYILKQEVEIIEEKKNKEKKNQKKKKGLFTLYIQILLWICGEYLNFPYDPKKQELIGENYTTINHCPHCMQIILNSVLELMILFIELNKFDKNLIRVLRKSLVELEINRRKSYKDKNNIPVYDEELCNPEKIDKCYFLLSTYLLKMVSHFVSLAPSTQPTNTNANTNANAKNPRDGLLLIDRKEKNNYKLETPPPYSLDRHENSFFNMVSNFLPVIPFRKLLMLTEKVLLNTLTEDRGYATMPANLNFYRYSSLPHVSIMAKEVIKIKNKSQELLNPRDLRIMLLFDSNGNGFQIYLSCYEKSDDKEFQFSKLRRLLSNKSKYFENKSYDLYWKGNLIKDENSIYDLMKFLKDRNVYDGLFLAFKVKRTSFFYRNM